MRFLHCNAHVILFPSNQILIFCNSLRRLTVLKCHGEIKSLHKMGSRRVVMLKKMCDDSHI